MRILLTSEFDFRFTANPLDLAEALAHSGHQVTVAAPFTEKAHAANSGRGFALLQMALKPGRLRTFRFVVESFQITRRHRPELLLGIGEPGLAAADLAKAFRLSRFAGWYALEMPLVKEHPRSLLVRWITLRARKTDFVIATGYSRAQVMMQEYRLSQMPLVLLNSPLSCNIGPSDRLRAALDKIGCRTGQTVVYAGNLLPEMLNAVRASRLWKSDASLVMFLIGGNSGLWDKLRAECSVPGTRCHVLPPIQGSRSELLQWLAGADAGIVLYDHYSSDLSCVKHCTPNKLYDYLACGLPVIASDNPSLLEDVQKAGCGICCDPRRPEAVAAATDRVLQAQQSLAARAKILFKEHLCFEKQAEHFCMSLAKMDRTLQNSARSL
jgi:glycosyltransferase involved in cell wall biosynthesis